MPMSPHKDESQSDFMSRCVPEMIGTGDNKRPQEQAVAICMDIWRNKDKQMKPNGDVIHKTTESKSGGLEFILSDATPDRFGDVIMPEGWDFASFKRNPIALFNHNANFPIGKWKNVRVEKDALRGNLDLAPEGTSQRIDEIRKLIEAGILKAVSVGFRPIETKPRAESDGLFYTKTELVETSLVSIPANPNALQVAKSLNISDATRALVFGRSADKGSSLQRLQSPGRSADTHSHKRNKGMSTITERIQHAQRELVAAQDGLKDHLAASDDDDVTDTDLETRKAFSEKIDRWKNTLESLQEAEKRIAITSTAGDGTGGTGSTAITVTGSRPFALPAKKAVPLDYMWRAAAIGWKARAMGLPADEIRQREFGDDAATKVIVDSMITRAAVSPATTTTSGWASQLLQTVYADFVEALMPASVYPRLAAMGVRLSFGRAGTISIPSRTASTTIAGSFVGEGAAIPVRKGLVAAITLTQKKLAVISTMTREIAEHSVPAIEGLIRNAMLEDTAVAIDTVLLDATTSSAIRPQGLLNGYTATTASTATGLTGLVADISALTNALLTSTSGNIRRPVWIMHPATANAVAMTTSSTLPGIFPFKEEIRANTLNNWPVIVSSTATAGTVILLDAADFVSVTGDDPRFEVSDQATIHEEDTSPAALSAVATPNTVAAPIRSLWQTDSIGVRLILPMNWALRRSGVLAFTQSVAWD